MSRQVRAFAVEKQPVKPARGVNNVSAATTTTAGQLQEELGQTQRATARFGGEGGGVHPELNGIFRMAVFL